MKKNLLILMILPLFGLTTISCNNQETPEPDASVSSESLRKTKTLEFFFAGKTSKSWIVYQQIYEGMDVTSTIPACVLDNEYTFFQNGTYIQYEGATKCSASDSDVYEDGTWAILNDSTIAINGSKFNQDVKILTLKQKNLGVQFECDCNGLVEMHLAPASKNPTK